MNVNNPMGRSEERVCSGVTLLREIHVYTFQMHIVDVLEITASHAPDTARKQLLEQENTVFEQP